MEWLFAFLRFLGLGRKERIEPVLDGYEGLTDRLERRIDGLESEIGKCVRGRKRLGKALSSLKGRVSECETDRARLSEQLNKHSIIIQQLEEKRLQELPTPPRRTTQDKTE